ncbi:MAG: four-carbon acid sugar kinase family protein [Acidobacteriota bacterium]
MPLSGLVLADDSTGALECASLLATLGLAATVTLSPHPVDLPRGVLIVDTHTRHAVPAQAHALIQSWTAAPAPLYKKTDSTLRGNIPAELRALPAPVLYLPAYPAVGRTLHQGILHVHGIPVHLTEFAADPRQPVRFSNLLHLLPEAQLLTHPQQLTEPLPPLAIADAATNDDLAAWAAALAQLSTLPTLAGPAGFLPHWARLHAFPAAPPAPRPKLKQWLVLCGSLHPHSRRQAELSAAPVLATPREPANPESAAYELAAQARDYIQQHHPDAVLIMGGDTARALWQALGVTTLEPLPELLPGVAACRSPHSPLVFVTKAGGFGPPTLVQQVKELFA